MAEAQESQSFECEALPDGQVRLSLSLAGEQIGGVEVPAVKIADVVAALLSASVAAGKLAGVTPAVESGESLHDVPTAFPSGIGLMQGVLLNSSALMLQFGPARIAVRLADKEMSALGQALGTLSAPRGSPQ